MKLTVLGRWSPYPPAGGACPGYLVEADGIRLLLDCGPGVIAKLRQFCRVFAVDALVITHMHPDHFLDIYTLALELRWGRFPQSAGPPLMLFAPRNAMEYLPACFPGERSRRELTALFTLHPLELESGRVGPLWLRFVKTAHPEPCHAVEVASAERRLVYSADTGPCEPLERLAVGADLFLCECTLTEGNEGLAEELGHLTGGMAGAAARRAGVRRLLLTHFFTPHHAVKESHAAAAKEFGDVRVAEEGATYEV